MKEHRRQRDEEQVDHGGDELGAAHGGDALLGRVFSPEVAGCLETLHHDQQAQQDPEIMKIDVR